MTTTGSMSTAGDEVVWTRGIINAFGRGPGEWHHWRWDGQRRSPIAHVETRVAASSLGGRVYDALAFRVVRTADGVVLWDSMTDGRDRGWLPTTTLATNVAEMSCRVFKELLERGDLEADVPQRGLPGWW
jgi:hypothetical protein